MSTAREIEHALAADHVGMIEDVPRERLATCPGNAPERDRRVASSSQRAVSNQTCETAAARCIAISGTSGTGRSRVCSRMNARRSSSVLAQRLMAANALRLLREAALLVLLAAAARARFVAPDLRRRVHHLALRLLVHAQVGHVAAEARSLRLHILLRQRLERKELCDGHLVTAPRGVHARAAEVTAAEIDRLLRGLVGLGADELG